MAFEGVTAQRLIPPSEAKPGLLIFFAPAGHRHRDAVCATLAWIAADESLVFECYYAGRASGVHYGGGLPWLYDAADLRGGTFEGGHHREQLRLVLDRFACQAVCLGECPFDQDLADAGVPVRARSEDVVDLYEQVLASSHVERPKTLLVIGGGAGRLSLVPYACHEVVQRKTLAIAGGDDALLSRFGAGMEIERLWPDGADEGDPRSVARLTLEKADRWAGVTDTFLMGDPEMVGRWIPAAVRHGWAPVFGIPQTDVVKSLAPRLGSTPVVWGRQQDDTDFLELSRAGVAFQLVDPGRPPFPVIAERGSLRLPSDPCGSQPVDDELRRWAADGRVVSTIVFWAGMVRELECLYALMDMFVDTQLRAGLALTTESMRYFDSSPLARLGVSPELGGLKGRLEVLVASAGAGGMLESEAPPERFAAALSAGVAELIGAAGLPANPFRGWWAVMDAPFVPRKQGRVAFRAWPPRARLRYRRRPLDLAAARARGGADRPSLRARVRESPLGGMFEAIRPFDGFRPGGPRRTLLEAVSAAGFEYALTKSSFGEPPTVATGVEGLTAINYTAGRWDGWTPFETINDLGDLRRAERALLGSRRPGWLLGSVDSCLWTFSGHVLDRGRDLLEICRWTARGGESGRLVNVTPHTMARYARILAEMGLVRTAPAG